VAEPLAFEFSGPVFCWRGPAPHYFVAVPEEASADIDDLAAMVSYGWGVIPVRVGLGDSEWKTSLFPKDGRYLVPLKLAVRRAEGVDEGDTVTLRLAVLS
jgi:Domain of unknown function (DUF1905)